MLELEKAYDDFCNVNEEYEIAVMDECNAEHRVVNDHNKDSEFNDYEKHINKSGKIIARSLFAYYDLRYYIDFVANSYEHCWQLYNHKLYNQKALEGFSPQALQYFLPCDNESVQTAVNTLSDPLEKLTQVADEFRDQIEHATGNKEKIKIKCRI
ncbi:uncharacterized protein LOC116288972 [Actinia tenebrosa]|uniref:Uncharacterized protein LOC116288972 n=1 Tax=Actinia tenebrosa TaxID=6105 RepID=A0A6P8H5P5_ACTTE|nr:uncharacterized protein LOC116288972 [Actinia tenebrosa]